MVDTPFLTWPFAGTNRPSVLGARTMPDRIQDVFNVKDFGAKGNYSADDTVAIEAAFTACGTAVGTDSIGGTVFFPPGGYKLLSGRGINTALAGGGARVIGSGPSATSIEGNVPNDFIFYQNDGAPGSGMAEIANLGLSNTSTNIGSGALRISDSSCYIHKCGFRGQICILLPFNIYDLIIESCGGVPNEHLIGSVPRTGNGYNGTIMVAGYAPHIIGWRSTGPAMTGFQLQGANGCSLIGNGIENCEEGMILGVTTGWASHCTTSGTTLTVGGNVQGDNYFGAGNQLWGSGLTLKPWNTDPMDPTQAGTWIIANLTGSGGPGTYTMNRPAPIDITTPVPMWTRAERTLSSCTIMGFQNEGCWVGVYVNNIGTSNIMSAGGGNALGEVQDQWGNEYALPHSGFWIKKTGSTLFSSCSGCRAAQGSIYIEPNVQQNSNPTFIGCSGEGGTDNTITASTSGTLLKVTALTSGPGLAVNIKVDPAGAAGVSANTVISGSKTSEPPTKTIASITTGATTTFTTPVTHGLTANTELHLVDLIGGCNLPSGLSFNTNYYVIATGLTTTQFRLSTTVGGASISTTGALTGINPLYYCHTDGTDGLSGYNGLGTFRINNTQTLSSRTMTLPFGPDWSIPADSGTTAKFINCSGGGSQPSLRTTTTFAYLPGQASGSFVSAREGMEYDITDGRKSDLTTALFGDQVVGGGAQHIKVRYDGTNWRRSG